MPAEARDMGIPDEMRALVYRGPGQAEVATISVPALGAQDVLVRVAYCGVCGTDLHIMSGDGGWGVPGAVYGHEWSGEVVAVGSGTRRWSPGDKVAGGESTCGTCEYCTTGRPSLCRNQEIELKPTSGGFSEYVKRHEDSLVAVDAGMDLRAAALAEPLAVALHGVTRSGTGVASRVLVTGAGPIGMLTLAALMARGVSNVVMSEPVSARRDKVRELGGTAVAPSELPDVATYIDVAAAPFDVAIECSGTVAATAQALGQLRPGGRLVIVGANFSPVPLDPLRVLVQELEIVGSRQYDADGFDDALALLRDGSIPWSAIIEQHHTPFEEFMSLVGQMQHGEVVGKPLVTSGPIGEG